MSFRVDFMLDFMSANDAVQEDPSAEVQRILREVADKIQDEAYPDEDGDFDLESNIWDLKGNKIGTFYLQAVDYGE